MQHREGGKVLLDVKKIFACSIGKEDATKRNCVAITILLDLSTY